MNPAIIIIIRNHLQLYFKLATNRFLPKFMGKKVSRKASYPCNLISTEPETSKERTYRLTPEIFTLQTIALERLKGVVVVLQMLLASFHGLYRTQLMNSWNVAELQGVGENGYSSELSLSYWIMVIQFNKIAIAHRGHCCAQQTFYPRCHMGQFCDHKTVLVCAHGLTINTFYKMFSKWFEF